MNEIQKAIAGVSGHWYQGDYGDGSGNLCGVGHLYRANTPLSLEDLSNNPDSLLSEANPDLYHRLEDSVKAMNDAAVEMFPTRTLKYFADFNDHPETTEADVIAVMERAAVLLNERLDTTVSA